MDTLYDTVLLSRLQFALTACFHILWPVFTIGLSLFLVTVEALWLRSGDADYYHHARFWSRLFMLNFTIGVISGLPLEFEFGTNWAPFSTFSGDYFGNILGFEGAMAFMLEAGFVGIMYFGWGRVPRGVHFLATCMVALGASLSAFWILVANSWMQTPAGGHVEAGQFVVDDYVRAIFNPSMPWGVGHMWVASLETSLFVIGGLSAWYVLRGRHAEFFLKSFKLVLLASIVVAPLQIWLGDGAGRSLFANQPAKGAALEGHWRTNPAGKGAAWALVAWPDKASQENAWEIDVPDLLSLFATRTLDGRVAGLGDFARADQPPALPLIFYAFRLMVAIGFWFLGLMCWTVWLWWRGARRSQPLERHRGCLRAWFLSIPLGYVAVLCGWVVREVGRQPWTVYGLLRSGDGASALPPASVAASLGLYMTIYAALFVAFLVFARRLVVQGPDMALTPPPSQGAQ